MKENIVVLLAITILMTACIQNNLVKPKKESVNSINMQYKEIIEQLNTKSINQGSDTLKTFISEYTYRASDDDSKNSARNKALREVKIIVLEEVGVYVESYLNMKTTTTNAMQAQIVKEEIRTLTAGIAKVKILEEKWDGKNFYIKVEMQVDPDSVSRGITEVLKVKANQQELADLKILLDKKEQEVDIRSSEVIKLQKKIASNAITENAMRIELQNAKRELLKAQQQLDQYTKEKNRIKTQLDKIYYTIRKKTSDAMNNVIRGMTEYEVKQVAGSPRSTDGYGRNKKLNYGNVWVHIENGVVACIVHANCDQRTSCTQYQNYPSLYNRKCVAK